MVIRRSIGLLVPKESAMSRQHVSSRKSPVGSTIIQSQREIASLIAALLAIVGLLFVMATSMPALSQGVQLVKVDVSVVGKGLRAGKLIGTAVVNDKNESIGKIDDIIIDSKRNMYAVLQVGGFLGVGSRLVAVPFDNLKIDDAGKKLVLPGATKDELKKLAEFKYLG
jgi:hypothetical protein